MSTNYYAEPAPCERPCDHCTIDSQHLGHTAVGWVFLAKAGTGSVGTIKDKASLFDAVWSANRIVDEYGREHSPDRFIDFIESKVVSRRRIEAGVWHEDGVDFTEESFT